MNPGGRGLGQSPDRGGKSHEPRGRLRQSHEPPPLAAGRPGPKAEPPPASAGRPKAGPPRRGGPQSPPAASGWAGSKGPAWPVAWQQAWPGSWLWLAGPPPSPAPRGAPRVSGAKAPPTPDPPSVVSNGETPPSGLTVGKGFHFFYFRNNEGFQSLSATPFVTPRLPPSPPPPQTDARYSLLKHNFSVTEK